MADTEGMTDPTDEDEAEGRYDRYVDILLEVLGFW